MKNKTRTNKTVEKSLLRSAGEVIGSIGYGIIEGKNKIVKAAHVISDTFSSEKEARTQKVKKTIKKASAKAATKKVKVKKTAKKAAAKSSRSSKKAAKKAKNKS